MVDVTDANFQVEVLDRSATTPVVVDLWAPWCGPCRTLGPILERVVDAQAGKVVLAKVNVDEAPGVAQAFRAQSIPAVHGVVDRQVREGFIGAQPEAKVLEFVRSLLPADLGDRVAALVEVGDEQSLREAIELDSAHEGARVALAKLLVSTGRTDEGLELVKDLGDSLEARHVRALAASDGTSASDVEAELASLLTRVKGDDDARERFLERLTLLDPADPATTEWRRRLTAELF